MNHSSRKSLLVISSILILLAFAPVADAQEPHPRSNAHAPDDGYGYVFTDDVMQAGAFTPDDPRITVISRAVRVTLIRPRTAFIAELLKSAESL